jgi:hypothetical protein
MLHVGELAKILAFLGDQREKLVATDSLFAGVLKKDGGDDSSGQQGTMLLSQLGPIQPCPSFEEEKKQLLARREREKRLKERKAKLEAEGITNRTEEEIEAMDVEERAGGSVASSKSSQILGNDKNPTTKVVHFTEAKKDAAAAQRNGSAAAAFAKQKVTAPLAAASDKKGAVVSGLAGLKSNNVGIKIFSNEGTREGGALIHCVSSCLYGNHLLFFKNNSLYKWYFSVRICFEYPSYYSLRRTAAGRAGAEHGHGGAGD